MLRVSLTLVAAFLLSGVSAEAQLSATQTVGITAIRESQLTLAVTSGSGQTVAAVDGGITAYPTPVRATLDWNFKPNTVNNVRLVGYFMNPASALSSGSGVIPSTAVEGRVGTTTAWGSFSQSYSHPVIPMNNANALLLYTSPSTLSANRKMAVTLDVFLRLNLTGLVLVPGAYEGTLVLQAYAQ